MTEQKRVFYFYRNICLMILIFFICYFSFHPAMAQTTITAISSDSSIAAGEDFSIDITIETDQTFVGTQMRIDFDNSLVSATKVKEGNLFSNSELFYIFNTGIIDNSQGSINNIFAVTLGAGGINNDGDFIHIDMTAGNISGVCNIKLENVICSNSEGIPIPVILNDASIEITASSPDQTKTVEAGSGGGGGGGGAGNTGENAENIEFVETKNVYVMSNNQTAYIFEDESNPITGINYFSLKNAGTISGTIEVLKGRSATVAEDPSGMIYKNMNIWLGKAGYASEANIDSPVITFKVSNEWIDENDVSEDSIVLKRYSSDKWNTLPTKKKGEDEKYTFFESETPGFSPFSIVSQIQDISEITNEIIPDEELTEENKSTSTENEDENKMLDQNTALLSCLTLLVLAVRKK